MANDAPIEKVTVTVNGVQIVLDPLNMKYNENSLGEFMNKEYGWIDYLGKQLEFAQKEVLLATIAVSSAKNDHEAQYSIKFLESKDAGNSDNYAKAFANASANVVAAKQAIIDAEKHVVERKEVVGHIKAHLKAWDTNHENVQNRGHTLRKEMDKLNHGYFEAPETCTAEEFLKGEA